MKNSLWQKIQLGIVGIALLTTFTACASMKVLWDELFSPKEKFFTHTVEWPNESLQIIAEWYTGDKEKWKALARANPDLDPDRISIEVEILIPQDLLKTREPMPKKFVDDNAPPGPHKVRKEVSPSPDEGEEKKELEPSGLR